MDENKNRVWNALRIYYGIAESLEFSDENCTQTPPVQRFSEMC